MANWSILKAAIASSIKTNGNQEITGAILQNTLNNIVSTVGENATFVGIATPTTNPGAPDGPVFYLASKPGIYANFNSISVDISDGVIILHYYNSLWHKVITGLQSANSCNLIPFTDSTIANEFVKELYIPDYTPVNQLTFSINTGSNNDWFVIYDGQQIVSQFKLTANTITKATSGKIKNSVIVIGNYILDKAKNKSGSILYNNAKDIHLSPYIAFYSRIDNLENDINTLSFDNKKGLTPLFPIIYQYAYILNNGNLVELENLQLSKWNCTSKIALVQLTKPIKLHNIIQYLQTSIPGVIFYDKDDNIVGTASKESITSETKLPLFILDDKNIPKNAVFFRCNCTRNFYIEGFLDEKVKILEDHSTSKSDYAAFSWVDDDFAVSKIPTLVQKCEDLGIRCTFAVIPSGSNDNDEPHFISNNVKEMLINYTKKGFPCEIHPIHKGWYEYEENTYKGRAYIESSLTRGIKAFNDAGLIHTSMVVYPGYNANPEIVNVAANWCNVGITASMANSSDNDFKTNKWQLSRQFINIDKSHNVTYWKNWIKQKFDAKKWVIIGTHISSFSITGDADGVSQNFANLFDIIQYANSLVPMQTVEYECRKRGYI